MTNRTCSFLCNVNVTLIFHKCNIKMCEPGGRGPFSNSKQGHVPTENKDNSRLPNRVLRSPTQVPFKDASKLY